VNRKLVDLLITRTGAEVVHVGNGAEALELATKESFDLILMDIQMPVMNGRDATRAIREAGVNTPILALTANVMAEDLQDYREAGCDDYLAKPIDKRRFYEALARYLTVRGETRAEANHQFQGTVLVAEDNEDNSRLVERLLRRYGVDVIKRGTGSEAVSTAMSETVHLILMDSHMPEMDGPEATRMLRQTGFRRPIIAFTAGDEAEVDELQKAGCDGVLYKPIDSGQLQVLLQKHFGDWGHSEAAETAMDPDIQYLVDQFLDGLPARLQDMEQAIHNEDWMALQRQVHQIKGTAGAMGYPLITEKAAEIERALKSQDVTHAVNTYPELESLIQQALDSRH